MPAATAPPATVPAASAAAPLLANELIASAAAPLLANELTVAEVATTASAAPPLTAAPTSAPIAPIEVAAVVAAVAATSAEPAMLEVATPTSTTSPIIGIAAVAATPPRAIAPTGADSSFEARLPLVRTDGFTFFRPMANSTGRARGRSASTGFPPSPLLPCQVACTNRGMDKAETRSVTKSVI